MQVQKVSQVKVQAYLALMVYLELKENLAYLDLKVGNSTVLFIRCIMFISDTMEFSTVHVKEFHQVFGNR